MNAFYNALYKYISPVFGYIMLGLFGIFHNVPGGYGIAVILFTVVARLVTLPTTISQQKGMAKQQRLAPKIRRIQQKYAGDQRKIQEETQNLYAREGYNPMSAGCLPLLIQFPFIIGLYGVLYNPLRYAIGLDATTSEQFVSIFQQMVDTGAIDVPSKTIDRYFPLYILQHFGQVKDYMAAHAINIISADNIAKVQAFVDAKKFEFLGLELGVVPSISQCKEVAKYWLIPVLSGLTSLISAYIPQLQQKKANPDQKTPGMGCTMLMMPLMSVWFTTMFPCGIGVYWIASNIFAAIQSVVIKKINSPQKNIAKLMIDETVERRSRENSAKMIKK